MVKNYTVNSCFSVKETIEQMTNNNIKAVVITDNNNTVIGLFSNGDMRGFFLNGGNLSSSILDAMNPKPVLYHSQREVDEERKKIRRVIYPIVDKYDRLIKIIDENDDTENTLTRSSSALCNVPLVIMAGGKGTRLYPFTKILPKPLIPIGDYTITERIIDSFRCYGCKQVHMVLNYKANMIKAYLNEIEKDYSVEYVEESHFLGTGGGLKLLQNKMTSTFVLSNCDTLLKADYECAYLTHKNKGNVITFVCAMKDTVIPYGVLETNKDGIIVKMKEKPDFSYLINTGVYFIEPEALDYISEDEVIGLPDVASRIMNDGKRVGVFPISEKDWMDMGQFSEMENMYRKLGLSM